MTVQNRLPAAAAVMVTLALLCLSLPAQAAQHVNGHLYVYWNWSGSGYWNVDQHLWVGQKAPATFWAQNWTWTGSSSGGYIGLQTDGTRFDGSRGDTAIFSLWNANGASGPSCGTFGGEGVGYSCKLPYAISTGRYYRLRVWRLNADGLGQWWGGWVLDEQTGVETHIGSIRVASAHQLIAPPMNFTEYYGTAVSCDAVPTSVVYWTQPAANHQGSGVYEYGSSYGSWYRGACTGGTVAPYNFGWTYGARAQMGGPR
jgi:hypothetical protein